MRSILPFEKINALFVLACMLTGYSLSAQTSFDVDTTEGCPPLKINLFNTSQDGNAYFWDMGDGTQIVTITKQDTAHTFQSPGVYEVQLVSLDQTFAPIDVAMQEITVFGLQEVFSSADSICPGEAVEFWFQGAGTSFHWDFGDGNTSDEMNPFNFYQDTGEYTVELIVQSACGADTAYKTIYVDTTAMPFASFGTNPDQACPGDEIDFRIDFAANPGYQIEWDFGDGSNASGEEVTHSYADTGMYVVTLMVTNNCGNTAMESQAIEIRNDVSLPTMFLYKQSACPGDPAVFHVVEGAPSFKYEWDFGDSVMVSGKQTEFHAFPDTGSYQVSVRVMNGCGDDTTLNTTIMIRNDIEPVLEGDSYGIPGELSGNICPGDSIVFYTAYQNSQWHFGDGDSANADRIIYVEGQTIYYALHAYTDTGMYTAMITVTNGCGISAMDSIQVMIADSGVAEIEIGAADPQFGNQHQACENIQFFFLGGVEYVVDYGDGTIDTVSGLTSNHTFAESGFYEVTVIGTNGCGQTDTMTQNIQIEGMSFNFDVTDLNCRGEQNGMVEVTLMGGVPPYDFNWITTGDTTRDLMNVSGGEYVLEVTDANGCSVTDTVEVFEPAELLVLTDTTVASTCGQSDGMAIVNAMGGVPPYSYNWDQGGSNDTLANVGAGNYPVSVTDSVGCMRSTVVSVSDQGAPAMDSSYADNATCHGGEDGMAGIQISGGTAPYTYKWSNGDSVQTSDTISMIDSLTAGNYGVVVEDSNGCATSINLVVAQPAMLMPKVLVQGDSIWTGEYASYQWHRGDSMIVLTGDTGRYLIVTESGKYTVMVQDSNGCEGVSNTIQVTVTDINVQAVSTSSNLVVYPNPYNGWTNIAYSVNETSAIELVVYNMLGEKVSVLQSGIQPEGNYTYRFSAKALGLNVGTYLVILKTSDGVMIQKLIETR